MLTVGNRHRGDKGIYAGRGTPFGNSVMVGGRMPGTRSGKIAAYRKWAMEALKDPTHEFTVAMKALAARHHAGEQITLVCSCAPKACHVDIIIELIEEGLV